MLINILLSDVLVLYYIIFFIIFIINISINGFVDADNINNTDISYTSVRI